MGFSSALQGRAAHEALVVRQDAELRLMETMKRTILLKAKCDKEYAVSLAAAAQQGLKIDRADELQGSLITKSWRSYIEELDQQAKQFKTNAELLEVVCEKMAHLSQDKRKARKSYQEEHSKIAARLNHLTDEVIRKKSEYQKHLEGYKALRTRFEEHYIKSGRGGRKLDDVRDKYQKACRKLHLTHNEYVLSISEAVEVERDFRTVMLPGLLEHQQSVQESFILLWKNILQEATQHSDLTSDKFKEIQRRIETAINNINPAEEYREFTEKHKTSPFTPVIFQFDETLIEDTPGKLQSNALTVDNLTIDWLRCRLNELESSVKECQEKQEKMVCDLNGGPLPNGNGINGKDTQKQSKDLNSVRCQEKQKQKLADLIKTALNEVGCEELPSGCDDLSVEQNFIENNFSNDQPATSNNTSASSFLQKGADVISIFKAPFKRKSTPQSPKAPPRTYGSSQTRSQSMGSLSVNSSTTDSRCSIIDSNESAEDKTIDCALIVEDPTNTIYTDIDVTLPPNPSCETNNIPCIVAAIPKECTASSSKIEPTIETIELNQPDKANDPIRSSIDSHLDKIDEINKVMDDKLIKTQPVEIVKPDVYLDMVKEDRMDIKSSFREKFKSKLVWNKDQNQPDMGIDEIIQQEEYITSDSGGDTKTSQSNTNGELVIKIPESNLSDPKKRSPSFSQRSFNTIFTTFRERNFPSKRSATKKKSIEEDTDMNSIIAKNEADLKISRSKSNEDISASSSSGGKSPANNQDKNRKLIEMPFKKSHSKRAKTDKKVLKPINNLKFGRNTFRSKLSLFQSKKSKLCKQCSKRRKIHPSRSVLDFVREFHTDELFENDFCACSDTNNDNNDLCESSSNDDVLCIKDHTYCEPFGMSFSSNRPLYEEEWFHGVLPREEVVRLLKSDGDFLVRETLRNEESQIVLSVCWNGHKHFIVQTTSDGHFRFEGPPFPSIQELIMHQYQSELPVTVKSGSILRRPVMRERWELSNDDVILLEKIGRGNFGDVYKAKLKSTKLDVAVKTCRMTLPDEQKRKFLQEGRILKQYDHPNIVKLIGICVQKQPIMIVMELVPGGSLLNFLRKNSNTLNSKQLLGMCRDAGAGMRYLESKNCIHRDLAARNCLVDFENSVKISDFGMSREEEEYIVSDGMKQIPVKWTAPEALNFGKYTTLCDVWSYGILMWEIFSKGDTPYSGMSNSRARERIDTGYRMPAPENTPPEMYRLMLKCWAAEPESRPHFEEIFTVVDGLVLRENS